MPKHAMPIITPRLIIRPATLDDLDAMQAAKEEMWHDLQLWMSWSFDNQKPKAALEGYLRSHLDYQNRDSISLVAFDKARGDFVLCTGLDLHEDHADTYETGYWVAKKYQGQGFATEATNAAIRYAFNHLGAKAITTGFYEGNIGSKRVIEKLGFTKLHVIPKGATRCLDGTKLDKHDYRMTDPGALPQLTVSWG